MNSFAPSQHILHDPGQLPQPPGGSRAYYSEVVERGLILQQALVDGRFGPLLTPGDFGLEPILAVHSARLVEFLRTAYRRMAEETGEEHVVVPELFAVWRDGGRLSRSVWSELGYLCYDTSSPIFANTWEAVYWSAQAALSAAADVAGGATAAYALCRPPGHHASQDLYGGFCYLNNAAIAAEWLIRQGRRVAIVDVDYHHGNGSQAIFYRRADLLFCSLHADPQRDYPFYWGYGDERGAGEGEGFNHNYPLPLTTDETSYLAALNDALVHVEAYGAEIIVVSLGFDTYRHDPVGGFLLGTESFRRIGARFAAMSQPCVLVQEGGYARDALGENLQAFLSELTAPPGP